MAARASQFFRRTLRRHNHSGFCNGHQPAQLQMRRNLMIVTEQTPNPKAMKFIPEGSSVLGAGTRTKIYRDTLEAGASPLAKALFELEGVQEVMLADAHVTVTKRPLVEWEDVQEDVEQVMLEFYKSGAKIIDESELETAGASQTFEEGTLEARIMEILEERVKPYVQQDGGDVEFDRFENGVLYLMMRGSCSGCSQSHATLQDGVKNLMDYYVPEVKEIVGLNEEPEEEIPRAR